MVVNKIKFFEQLIQENKHDRSNFIKTKKILPERNSVLDNNHVRKFNNDNKSVVENIVNKSNTLVKNRRVGIGASETNNVLAKNANNGVDVETNGLKKSKNASNGVDIETNGLKKSNSIKGIQESTAHILNESNTKNSSAVISIFTPNYFNLSKDATFRLQSDNDDDYVYNDFDIDKLAQETFNKPINESSVLKIIYSAITTKNDEDNKWSGEPNGSSLNFYENNYLLINDNGSYRESVYSCLDYFSLEEEKPSETPSTLKRIYGLIEELINTEENYVSRLQNVIQNYMPFLYNTCVHQARKISSIFGNIKIIYKNAISFLELLKQNKSNLVDVIKIFCIWRDNFECYTHYSRNKPTANVYLEEFDSIIKERERELKDRLTLRSSLLTPIDRLAKYLLLLNEMQKEMQKAGQSVENVNEAVNVIHSVMKKSNDLITIDLIKECDIDLTLYGEIIKKATFTILKPRKYTSIVYLFDDIIVFTEDYLVENESMKYVDSIELNNLHLLKCEHKACIFHLTNYTKYKRKQKDATIILEAETPEIKNEWTQSIEENLWKQYKQTKEQQDIDFWKNEENQPERPKYNKILTD